MCFRASVDVEINPSLPTRESTDCSLVGPKLSNDRRVRRAQTGLEPRDHAQGFRFIRD